MNSTQFRIAKLHRGKIEYVECLFTQEYTRGEVIGRTIEVQTNDLALFSTEEVLERAQPYLPDSWHGRQIKVCFLPAVKP